MKLSLIVAAAENGCIGRDGQLPWHLPDDLRFFKRVTLGKPVIMGRVTYDSIGKPLPGRENIVLTHQKVFPSAQGDTAHKGPIEGLVYVNSLAEALSAARNFGAEEAVVIGGASLFEMTLAEANVIYITRVHAVVEGDTFFPDVDWHAFELLHEEYHPQDERHPYDFTFQTWRRRASNR